jgi:hypothetical protein
LLRGLDKFVGNLDGCSHVTIETPLFLMTTFNYLELAREGLKHIDSYASIDAKTLKSLNIHHSSANLSELRRTYIM